LVAERGMVRGGAWILAFVVVAASPCTAALTLFSSEPEAQHHCPADTVVWLNLPSGIYHFRGQRWYGATRAGAYVCRREADAAGDRATRNGE
jgi:hypothetical protein